MADTRRGDDGTPYPAACRLVRWAIREWNTLDGWYLYNRGVTIGRFGTRSLANAAYAYLITQHVEDALSTAEQQAAQQSRGLDASERQRVIRDAVRDFDDDLERAVTPVAGVEPERLVRARQNARAFAALLPAFERANEEVAD